MVVIGAPSVVRCPKGHVMQIVERDVMPAAYDVGSRVYCDRCPGIVRGPGTISAGEFMHCPICRFDLCQLCAPIPMTALPHPVNIEDPLFDDKTRSF